MLVVRGDRVEVVRFVDEWCMSLPEWWASRCGCKRSCEADQLWATLPHEHRDHLAEYGYTVIQGWTLVRDGVSITLFPWPKKLYQRLWVVK